ncbi:TolC family protein [Capnocytophaga granulosa]|uniref:TolC family protein n=1 Tax=Capnocytophaga granulosa TaxID=45242 RepID=UPI0023F51172|nr:TolC family protein [Capnocytophaga granulosa]
MRYLLLLLPFMGFAQEVLTLEDCYRLARDHYPTVQKLDLITRSEDYTLANANKAYLPQVSITGQASYQSETIDFSESIGRLPLPISLPKVSKDQYKVVGEVSQLLYNGGATRAQKQLIKAQSAVQTQAVETQLYALKQRVSNLYFGVLLIDTQLSQNQLNVETVQSQLEKAETALKNGTTLPSNVAELKAELVRLAMQRTEYEATKAMYLQMLSTFIGKDLPSDTVLNRPKPTTLGTANHRPELKGFDLQQSVLDIQERQLTSEYLPKIGLFFQGAYGRPTLNIIKNEFDFYYIAGVRLQWNLSPLYSLSNRKQLLQLQGESLSADRKAFLMSTELDLTQQQTQISKLQRLMEQDQESAALRHSVAQAAQVQLDNGIITTHEYLQKVNAENLAKQTLLLHEIQLLQAQENQHLVTND